MKRRVIAASFIATGLAFSVTSCSADKEQAKPASGCEEVLGAAGLEWVQEKAQADDIERGGVNLDEFQREYDRQMKPWKPTAQRWESEVCTITSTKLGDGKKLTIEFGPSSTPFDFDERETPDGVVTPVNADVKLQQVKDFKDVTHYGVYVKCKVSGTSSRQEIVTPLAGVLTDTLTDGVSDAARIRHLLRATQAVVNSLGCENDPSVPATPPA
ncbi:hypothetical protein ACFSUJ_25380 [Streptomyces lusitanus]|uniref:Lipoprotein n=1 Tax=Streptomyces lusitanus TaxID=68232 RepID=A0ABU3K0Y8_9ACTN|nr:hypothetical protein [Streptomyces lusitanus]